MINDDDDNSFKYTNRQKSKRATKQKFWCHFCDADLVGEFGKCGNCGRKHYAKKNKNI